LRKLIAEPHEYVLYPPALGFFNKFLLEKGCIAKSTSKDLIGTIDKIEPHFIAMFYESDSVGLTPGIISKRLVYLHS